MDQEERDILTSHTLIGKTVNGATVIQTIILLGALIGCYIGIVTKITAIEIKVDAMWAQFLARGGARSTDR